VTRLAAGKVQVAVGLVEARSDLYGVAPMIRTLTFGIDLAAQPERTGACLVEWEGDGAGVLRQLQTGLADAELLEVMVRPEVTRVGIDAPFGWPMEFLQAVSDFRDHGSWPDAPDQDSHQRSMRLRVTDWVVREKVGVTPLSVASDKIASVAMRCARLQSAYWEATGERPDRSGAGRLCEVYPAASLRLWKLSQHDDAHDPGTYRGLTPGAMRRRKRIMNGVIAATSGRIEIPPWLIDACETEDHLLDALVCALTARAAHLGHVQPIAEVEPARSEGWITLPDRSLSQLTASAADTDTVETAGGEPEKLMPPEGYFDLYMPEQFELAIQDRVGGPWGTWATGLRAEWFVRGDDGTYMCSGHGGSPIYIRALSIDDRGVIEHVDGDGFGHVYRYRLVPETPERAG
jgi:Protein of unknown function (DUF429)